MNERPRKPAAFRLDDPDVIVTTPEQPPMRGRGVVVTPDPEPALPVPVEAIPLPPRRRWRWGTLFWSACGGLVLLGLGLSVAHLIQDLFSYSDGLGYLGAVLSAVAVVALGVVITRETLGLLRLATVERLHARAAEILINDDRNAGRAVVRELLSFERSTPHLARARADLETHLTEIIDGADLIRLAERELMAPLDVQARRMVSAAAKRVSLVTAVSPRAAVDLLFVLYTALSLMRRLARLYGSRPGTLGMIRVFRLVLSHLALTGGLAASDSLISQVLGHGVAARVSARLGEGVLNGLLTARLGLAAIEVTRPLPFAALPPPALNDLAGELIRPRKDEVAEERR
ncbi:MAG: TIGR01620 family protein [Xanthobacteraceae bacterium]|nr:TIGR01620 family protein [Xanthobacteraceae bacterium]